MDLNYWVNVDTEDNTNVSTALLYTFDSFTVNSKTGKLCDYNGEDIAATSYEYNDLAGSDNLKIVNILKQHGIALYATEDGKFAAEELITEKEFLDLLTRTGLYPYYNGASPDSFEKDFIYKKDAVKYFIQAKYHTDAFDIDGIFKSLYDDVTEDDPYVGYISAAKAENFITSRKIDKFYPNNKLKRMEALVMIYNYFVTH